MTHRVHNTGGFAPCMLCWQLLWDTLTFRAPPSTSGALDHIPIASFGSREPGIVILTRTCPCAHLRASSKEKSLSASNVFWGWGEGAQPAAFSPASQIFLPLSLTSPLGNAQAFIIIVQISTQTVVRYIFKDELKNFGNFLLLTSTIPAQLVGLDKKCRVFFLPVHGFLIAFSPQKATPPQI